MQSSVMRYYIVQALSLALIGTDLEYWRNWTKSKKLPEIHTVLGKNTRLVGFKTTSNFKPTF